ncbi:hypothetical protein Acsp01_58300 [Actinoplanes sp. NBRC 101535]|nr:hypothetical protein Acsp01_58300 [Actinoplanes sp. NBRC 101535]
MRIADEVRAEALRQGIPAADVDRWLDLARPCALLTQDGDGPVAGAVRGPVLLPAGVEDPWFPLIATIDCAALPAGTTDLPLPADGRLLLFGWPEEDGFGQVKYVPADAVVEERQPYPPPFTPDEREYAEVYAELRPGDLRLTADISLPYAADILPGHPHAAALAAVWEKVLLGVPDGVFAHRGHRTPLLIGGYGTDDNGLDPVQAVIRFDRGDEEPEEEPDTETANPDGWLLLAEFHGGRPGGATIFWMIRRDDLIERRFDQARTLVDWNP